MRARLGSLRIFRDVINKFGPRSARRPGELDGALFRGDTGSNDFILGMDGWFLDAMGRAVQYTGNAGNGVETEYGCYVLAVCRRGAGAEEPEAGDVDGSGMAADGASGAESDDSDDSDDSDGPGC